MQPLDPGAQQLSRNQWLLRSDSQVEHFAGSASAASECAGFTSNAPNTSPTNSRIRLIRASLRISRERWGTRGGMTVDQGRPSEHEARPQFPQDPYYPIHTPRATIRPWPASHSSLVRSPTSFALTDNTCPPVDRNRNGRSSIPCVAIASAAATVPVPHESVSASTPHSYVRSRQVGPPAVPLELEMRP